MTGGLHVPGPGGVPDLGGRPAPSTAEVLAAQNMALQQQVDMLFQFVARLAIGWDVRDVIEDMQLNVAPVPGTEPFEPPTALREAVEKVVAEDADLTDPPEGDLEDQAASILSPNRETRRAAMQAARKKGTK